MIEIEQKMEDIPRKKIKLKEIKEFDYCDKVKLLWMEKKLQKLISHTKYNTLIYVDRILQEYENNLLYNKKCSLIDVFRAFNFSEFNKLNIFKEGGNCIQMAQTLKKNFQCQGIKSYIIRFKATGLINEAGNNYAGSRHCAVIIPELVNRQLRINYFDPGLLIPHPIIFNEDDENSIAITGGYHRKFHITKNTDNDFPHKLVIDFDAEKSEIKAPGEKAEIPFNMFYEWLNPNETSNQDCLRCLPDVKITKQTSEGVNLALIQIYFNEPCVKVKLHDKNILVNQKLINLTLPVKNFLKNTIPKETQKDFDLVCRYLGENPVLLKQKINRFITHLADYKEQIWAPSVR